jgi:hypothetical protein
MKAMKEKIERLLRKDSRDSSIAHQPEENND